MCGICDGDEPGSSPLQVFAAGSLRSAFDRIAALWPAPVDIRYANAAVLAEAILAGEPADVFASASPEEPRRLASLGIAEPAEPFAVNRLVVAVPAGSDIDAAGALAEPGVRVVIEEPGIPLGDYTRELLAGLDGEYGEGFARRLMRNVAMQGDNVDAVSAAIYDGHADAAILYATDVAASRGRLRAIELPPVAGVRATYVICVLRAAQRPVDARAWVDLTLGPSGRAALEASGFVCQLS